MKQEQEQKPRGYFQYLLAIDCETTGYNKDEDDVSIGHQAVSWGIIVADAKTLQPVEEIYLEIKYNKESRLRRKNEPDFGVGAAAVHGLSFDYLEKNGIDEEEAVLIIVNLILKYLGPTACVKALGHNIHTFDIPFLRGMCRRHGIELQFGSRHYDTNSMGFATTGSYISDALFETMGFDSRGSHNALEDAKMALESARRIRILWDQKVGVKAYD